MHSTPTSIERRSIDTDTSACFEWRLLSVLVWPWPAGLAHELLVNSSVPMSRNQITDRTIESKPRGLLTFAPCSGARGRKIPRTCHCTQASDRPGCECVSVRFIDGDNDDDNGDDNASNRGNGIGRVYSAVLWCVALLSSYKFDFAIQPQSRGRTNCFYSITTRSECMRSQHYCVCQRIGYHPCAFTVAAPSLLTNIALHSVFELQPESVYESRTKLRMNEQNDQRLYPIISYVSKLLTLRRVYRTVLTTIYLCDFWRLPHNNWSRTV